MFLESSHNYFIFLFLPLRPLGEGDSVLPKLFRLTRICIKLCQVCVLYPPLAGELKKGGVVDIFLPLHPLEEGDSMMPKVFQRAGISIAPCWLCIQYPPAGGGIKGGGILGFSSPCAPRGGEQRIA